MKTKLAVLFGGKSVEHEISIISAVQAMSCLNREKYDVIPIYITKNNEFYTGADLFDIDSYKGNIGALTSRCQKILLVNEGGKVYIVRQPQKRFGNNIIDYIDIAFPIVHGTNVEDGALQGYLQTLNLPYVGCDVTASAVGMDKYVMKTVLKDNGIPVLDCKVYNNYMFEKDPDKFCDNIEENIGFPLIIKPINLGSSIGIKKANDSKGLHEAVELAFEFSQKILAEPVVQNLREINCAVLGDLEHAQASECEEPVNSDEILSYENKYMDNGTKGMSGLKRKLPADITPEKREEIRTMAVKTFKALGCNGVARIDFMMDSATGQVWVNEINTIPGSLSFYLWESLGMKYQELLDKMIELSLKRKRLNATFHFSFDTNVLSGVSLGGSKGAKGSGKLSR